MRASYVSLAVATGLVAAMAWAAVDHIGQRQHDQPPFDLALAVAYSKEYGLAFDPFLGGPEHLAPADDLRRLLNASLDPAHPESAQMARLLDLHGAILADEQLRPGGPYGALAEILGAGGGTRLRHAIDAGAVSAQRELAVAEALAAVATGRTRSGLGFAPSAADVVAHWQERLAAWQDIAAQAREAEAPYSSFFAGPASQSIDAAWQAAQHGPRSDAYHLFSVPDRVATGKPATNADAAGYLASTAAALGLPTALVVGLDAEGAVAYCVEVGEARYCRDQLTVDLGKVAAAVGLGFVSASIVDADVADAGGRLGLFNSQSQPDGPFEVHAAAVDGSWNSSASIGPIPGDGARFAYFDTLGDGPAWITVTRDGHRVARWLGESVAGLGIVAA